MARSSRYNSGKRLQTNGRLDLTRHSYANNLISRTQSNPLDLEREILLALLLSPIPFEFPSYAELASAAYFGHRDR